MKDKLKEVLEKNQSNCFYKVNDDSLTYKELLDKSLVFSSLLKKQGDSPVIIYGHKEINVVISIISCILAGRTYIPIGLCTPVNRLKQIIKLTNSNLILTDRDISINDIEITNLDGLKKYESNKEKKITNDIAYIIFTSGSTGIPKGVPITYDNLLNFINWISNLNPINEYKNVNVFNQASFSFDLSVADFYYSLFNDHTLYALLYDIKDNYEGTFEILKNIDFAVMTPTFMKLCLLNNEFNSINYPKLKCVYFCGEMLENKLVKKIIDRFPKLEIINAYGPTEATSAISAINMTKEIIDKYQLLPVGDMDNLACNVEIINDEIVLSGKSVSNGYLGNVTGGFFKKNNINYYKTGDLGFIKDNMLFCKGRIDSQVKYSGYRIELNEIEYNINNIDRVKECAVIAKYNEEGICKAIKAYVVGDNISSDYISSELEEIIPKYMIPKSIIIVDELPLSCNYKIDRKSLGDINE